MASSKDTFILGFSPFSSKVHTPFGPLQKRSVELQIINKKIFSPLTENRVYQHWCLCLLLCAPLHALSQLESSPPILHILSPPILHYRIPTSINDNLVNVFFCNSDLPPVYPKFLYYHTVTGYPHNCSSYFNIYKKVKGRCSDVITQSKANVF